MLIKPFTLKECEAVDAPIFMAQHEIKARRTN